MAGKADKRLLKQYRAPFRGGCKLSQFDPEDTGGLSKAKALKLLSRDQQRLSELQNVLYAEGKHSVLVVLQATDTGGKDGTIRKVLGPLNPQGVEVSSFKVPTAEELAHDYLWRIHKRIPAKGMIGVFNRSHYEEVLVVRVHNLVPRKDVNKRYEEINQFEKHLAANGVTIVKFFLHISKKEQAERLQARLDDPSKHWKFSLGDLEERKLWGDYQKAYALALGKCSTPWAPWFVIPANHKWYRNYLIGRILRLTLEDLKLRYPKNKDDLSGVKIV